jgi:DNA-binding response OmpR family regulator
MSKGKILVVEDEKQLARLIELELKFETYEVLVAYDGEKALELAEDPTLDLILLDIMIPIINGIDVCKKIRQNSDVPIILLTAKSDTSDKVIGLDSGADDYITKPFEMTEVLARIRTAMRRSNTQRTSQKEALSIKNVHIDKSQHTVSVEQEAINLTKKEFDLLFYMAENKNIALSRDQILENVWGYDYYGDTNVVDVYIRYLRSKIDNVYNISLIETIRGVGYTIRD